MEKSFCFLAFRRSSAISIAFCDNQCDFLFLSFLGMFFSAVSTMISFVVCHNCSTLVSCDSRHEKRLDSSIVKFGGVFVKSNLACACCCLLLFSFTLIVA